MNCAKEAATTAVSIGILTLRLRKRDYRLGGFTAQDREVARDPRPGGRGQPECGRIAWTDIVDILRDMDAGEGRVAKTNQAKKNAFKSTLSLRSTFNPTLDIRIDTMSCTLDIFRFLTGFRDITDGDLGRTTFVIDTALSFAARLDISPQRRTPFQFNLDAAHLDLASVVPNELFGITLLRNSMPFQMT
jgi:hypothetical protein